jgi:hydrogenase expression/formation protein HypC
MCIGAALQVVELEGSCAWCECDEVRERIDMLLVGPQAPGTWVLASLGVARRVLSDVEAGQARAARQALAAALAGDTGVDAFFADLLGREPQLPAHLLSLPVSIGSDRGPRVESLA